MAFASADDVSVRWGRQLTDEETALIEVRLADVERMIVRRIPDLELLVLDGSIDVEDVRQVEADCVLRLARNPEGYVSETDGNYTYTLHKELASGKLMITPEEWEILGVSPSGFFTLVPSFLAGDGTTVIA